jgi:hypothetical protein
MTDDEPLPARTRLADLVSNQTGATTTQVERVLDLLQELEPYTAQLDIENGEIVFGWLNGFSSDEGEWPDVPEKLQYRAGDLEFDIHETLPAIYAAWPKVYGNRYPWIMHFGRSPGDPADAPLTLQFTQRPTE